MLPLETYSQVETALAATAAYDVSGDVESAKIRVAALRRKLDFAEQSDENGKLIRFNHEVVQNQLDQALSYIRNVAIQSPADLLANPSVIHADFSGMNQYDGGGFGGW